MSAITYTRTSVKYANSFFHALDQVAKERKYLAMTKAFPLKEVVAFVKNNEEKNLAQFFALDREKVIGWCDILPLRHEGFTHIGDMGMGIIETYRRQGIGQKLLDIAIKHAQEINGIEKIELSVYRSNDAAIKLYQKNKFIIEGEKVKSRKLDGKYDNLVLMGRIL